jgi:hypothetical protein
VAGLCKSLQYPLIFNTLSKFSSNPLLSPNLYHIFTGLRQGLTLHSPFNTSRSLLYTSQSPIDTIHSLIYTSQSAIKTSRSLIYTSQSPIDTSRSLIYISQSAIKTSRSLIYTSQSPIDTSRSPKAAGIALDGTGWRVVQLFFAVQTLANVSCCYCTGEQCYINRTSINSGATPTTTRYHQILCRIFM